MTLTGCGHNPEEVCDKMVELAKTAGAEVSDEEKKECVSSEERKKEMKGMMKYKDYSNCIVDSKTLEDAVKCK